MLLREKETICWSDNHRSNCRTTRSQTKQTKSKPYSLSITTFTRSSHLEAFFKLLLCWLLKTKVLVTATNNILADRQKTRLSYYSKKSSSIIEHVGVSPKFSVQRPQVQSVVFNVHADYVSSIKENFDHHRSKHRQQDPGSA